MGKTTKEGTASLPRQILPSINSTSTWPRLSWKSSQETIRSIGILLSSILPRSKWQFLGVKWIGQFVWFRNRSSTCSKIQSRVSERESTKIERSHLGHEYGYLVLEASVERPPKRMEWCLWSRGEVYWYHTWRFGIGRSCFHHRWKYCQQAV